MQLSEQRRQKLLWKFCKKIWGKCGERAIVDLLGVAPRGGWDQLVKIPQLENGTGCGWNQLVQKNNLKKLRAKIWMGPKGCGGDAQGGERLRKCAT